MTLLQKFLSLCLCLLAFATASAGIDPNDPRGAVESFTPDILKTNTATDITLTVRNTGVATNFRVASGTAPSGWSVLNLTPGQKFISNNKTATFKFQINPGSLVGNGFGLPVTLYGDDVFGMEKAIITQTLIIDVVSPPLPFSIVTPGEDEVVNGVFIIAWSGSTYADTYSLKVTKLNGNTPAASPVINVTGIHETFYQATTTALQKGANYQIEVTAKNVIAETINSGGPRFFSVLPAPALGAFSVTNPLASSVVGPNPDFAWSASANATSYRMTIYPDSNGQPATNSPIRNVTQAGLSYHYADPPLPRGRTYYVGVVAIGEAGEKSSAPAFVKFSIPAIEAFSLISPAAEQQLVYTSVSFSWNSAVGADRYTISIFDELPTGRQLYIQSGISQSPGTLTFFLPENKPLLANHRYAWEVTAFAGSASLKNFEGLRFLNTLQMSSFALLSPKTRALDVSPTPTFSWVATLGASYYNVQIAPSNAAGNVNEGLAQIGASLSGTSWPSEFPALELGKKYFWRVFASDGVNTITNSGSWQPFTVDPLTDFVLTAPADHSEDVELSPIFQWQKVATATGYVLRLSITGELELPPILIEGNTNNIDLLDREIRLNGDTTYQWTVDALAEGVIRSSLETRTFTTTFRTAEQFTSCDVIDHLVGREHFSSFDRLVLGIFTPPLDSSYYRQYLLVPEREECVRE